MTRQVLKTIGLFSVTMAVSCGTDVIQDDPNPRAPVTSRSIAPGIDADLLLEEIRVLASDEFEGRAPGSPGEERTISYLTDQFKALGLVPGNRDGTWVQVVPLVGIKPQDGDSLVVRSGVDADHVTWVPGDDYVALTKHVVDEVEVNAEFVFAGYGAVAPEYDWDDFGDVDVAGKILLFLVNDPPVDDAFGGSAMTYYGRWTYKHEIAAEKGAVGSFVIHETESAGYPWEVIGSSPYGESFSLISSDNNLNRATIEGWVHRSAAESLFEMAGLSFEELKQQASDPSFQPVALGVSGKTRIRNLIRTIDSQNFLAMLPGAHSPNEIVIYVAHWDHLGKDSTLVGDQIFNGAADNATGTAGLIEVARAFTELGAPPRRSVLFMAVTAEEQGLLGSAYYGKNPIYPTQKTVAALNMDVLNQWGRTRDLTVVGMGQSEIDLYAADVAKSLQRTLVPDPEPEKGFYYRSDHFSFAKVGIPAFYADPGIDYLEKSEGYGLRKREEYTTSDYHAVTDEVKLDWDLSGAAEDLTFMFELGALLATTDDWPEWSVTSEFRSVREADRAQ